MLDACNELKKEYEEFDPNKDKSERFSFDWIVDKIINRQKYGKDTIIVVIGERRNGKSNFGLKLIRAYIKCRRKDNPKFKWSWSMNFPITRSKAIENVDKIEEKSFVCYDEAGDIAYRGDTQQLMNKKLIKFMSKSGKKKLLTLIILPDLYTLDSKILRMALMLIAVPYRYQDVCSWAFFYGKSPNPFIEDKFGLERIKRMFMSRKMPQIMTIPTMSHKMKVHHGGKEIEIPYPKPLFTFLKSLPTYVHSLRFTKANSKFENLYIKNVKDKQLMAHMEEDQFVKYVTYKKFLYRYAVLLYNLYVKGEISYTKLEKMHADPEGGILFGKQSIKKLIDSVSMKFDLMKKRKYGITPHLKQEELDDIDEEKDIVGV